MVRSYLTDGEEVEETYKYQPKISIGFLPLVPNPFRKSTYYVTNKRVLENNNTLFGQEIKDVPLDEVLSISHSTEYRPQYILYAVLMFLFVGNIFDRVVSAILGLDGFAMFVMALLLSTVVAAPLLMQTRVQGAKIQTANPDVNILLPPANDQHAGKLINTVRQKVEDFEQ